MVTEEIGIVTAFFDIGRGELIGGVEHLKRNNDTYLEYFRFWARIHNTLIVYTEKKFANRILEIRTELGQKDKTRVVIVDDVTHMESQIYKRMCEIEQSGMGVQYKYNNHAMSGKAVYDYIMMMKYRFMQDAVSKGWLSGQVAWVDFGFNHGGECYSDSTQFDFGWEYAFPNRIQLFSLRKDIDKIGAGYSLLLQCDMIQGDIVVAPAALCGKLWEMIKTSMEALLMLDTIDDDQQLLFMAYRQNPELFDVHHADWFMQLKEFGAEFLTLKNKEEERTFFSFKAMLWNTYIQCRERFRTSHNIEYSKRMLEIVRKEYPQNG